MTLLPYSSTQRLRAKRDMLVITDTRLFLLPSYLDLHIQSEVAIQ